MRAHIILAYECRVRRSRNIAVGVSLLYEPGNGESL